MRMAADEDDLYDYDFVVAGHYQRAHFHKFFPLLFDKLEDMSLICYAKPLSDNFLDNYDGHVIVLTKYKTESLSLRERRYKTIMIAHGPLPVGPRSRQRCHCDYLIVNGSPELVGRIDLDSVGKTLLDGYFPTDYFLPVRRAGNVLVQVTEETKSSIAPAEVCRLLLNQGYKVSIYNHVIFKTDFASVPRGVRVVKPGREYVETLSSSSHFVYCGTSGFITCMYTPGCRLICLGERWAGNGKTIFSEILKKTSYVVNTPKELINSLECPPKYGWRTIEYLFGRDRTSVVDRIRGSLKAIAEKRL